MNAYLKGMAAFKKRSFFIGADFTVSAYRTIAEKLSASSVLPYGVIAFTKNNETPSHFEYQSAEGANNQFDALSERPGDYVYLYLYREHKPVDEAYFTATAETKFETKKEVRKERVGLGWILGGVGLGLLGMASFRKRS